MVTEGAPVMSWEEAKAMCEGVGDVFAKNAAKDRDRLLKLRDTFGSIRGTFAQRQAAARRAVEEALAEIRRIEQHEQGRDNSAEMARHLDELAQSKAQLETQLARLQENQVATEAHIEELILQYEQAQRRYMDECATREKDVPRLRQNMAVYASITGIKWDFSSDRIAGCIHIPERKLLSNFDLSPTQPPYEMANALWNIIETAHEVHQK
ncbi:hypothetical protein SPRG_08774 [Saprolegnia parasitica CBS 223.65]|uniref:Kinetochore protein Spc24 n=1 Tax=Saprolegnia parasitica (strain CBS 223.65) TaxID=695850 RepID=A0A067C9I4_SAPPC|nr:hypothetical protein SPRG_08774 [Saprolegnia parasitica CBS 223.65]KDO25830.1 hypothetical protein SPRG_08774 [Saprolegnia parasitica CBS 223.65]|eukprot:XP_012203394.1 hypothetical protein SPRG_08774 [Saprolegnia parasitica CBS 223.65]